MPSGAADLQRLEERVHAAAVGGAGAAQALTITANWFSLT